MINHFLSITDLKAWQVRGVLSLASDLKREHKRFGSNAPILAGKTLAMIFEKPSLRTRLSFEAGMTQLGGHAVCLNDIGLGVRESAAHVARVAGSMADAVLARVFDHQTLLELAAHSSTPVINGLSDLEHPCQILADLLTIQEYKGTLKGSHLAFVGDGENNITHSLLLAAGLLGMHITVASPKGYLPLPSILKKAKDLAQVSLGSINVIQDPKKAVAGADVVYTDTWVSMGDEGEKENRLRDLAPYQVTSKLMKLAKPNAIFMHDMPAYLGQEVTKEVFESTQSVVFDQAENRLHAQKALLVGLMGSYQISDMMSWYGRKT